MYINNLTEVCYKKKKIIIMFCCLFVVRNTEKDKQGN